jgi:hypothetical protein
VIDFEPVAFDASFTFRNIAFELHRVLDSGAAPVRQGRRRLLGAVALFVGLLKTPGAVVEVAGIADSTDRCGRSRGARLPCRFLA